MSTPTLFFLPRALVSSRNSRLVSLVLVVSCLLAASGCGKSGPKDSVTGKVTFNGDKVDGTITFVGSDGKKASVMLDPNGIYLLPNPPKGECKITIVGSSLPNVGPPPDTAIDPKNKAAMKDMKPGVSMGVPPPKKYESPDNGLKFTVTSGKQTFDIKLES